MKPDLSPPPARRKGLVLRETRSDYASALDQMDNRHNHGDDQNKMDESAPDVEGEGAEGPKHQQDQSDRQ